MTSAWDITQSRRFWLGRRLYVIADGEHEAQSRQRYIQHTREREQKEHNELHEFIVQNNLDLTAPDTSQDDDDLRFWAVHASWKFCKQCKCLVSVPLKASFRRRNPLTAANGCSCLSGRYIIPREFHFPHPLVGLTKQDIITLRPFDLHNVCASYVWISSEMRVH